ncbi:MAG: class I SAM-dependent methyltransferase [Mycobacterium sp.]|nr:class I SAM-dependent methyltransferase [Mycobacterium sp.]
MTNRWQRADVPRGDDYDARWRALAATGTNIHGEADLVESMLAENGGRTVFDAGCGTGRVAIELARRGIAVVGADVDAGMLGTARTKAPDLTWIEADLADLAEVGGPFDLVLLAGNVMIFLEPGTEERVVANLVGLLVPGGLLVAGFSLRPGRLSVDRYDELTASAGMTFWQRFSTWDREPFDGGDYAVSAHRRTAPG